MIPMKHEFFMRISRAFPALKYFSLENGTSQTWNGSEWKSNKNSSYLIIEYLHLISLDIMHVNIDYIAQFLLETKTNLPRLTELKVKSIVVDESSSLSSSSSSSDESNLSLSSTSESEESNSNLKRRSIRRLSSSSTNASSKTTNTKEPLYTQRRVNQSDYHEERDWF
ncbi:unnamed protein product [Rotaria sp. Silwood1]|nr:unnamed protein product [Rotaria sp. Silwood1]